MKYRPDRKRTIADRLAELQLEAKKTPKPKIVDPKEYLKHPISKAIIGAVAVYGLLKVSKYFINAYSDLVKATRNLKSNR